MIFSHVLLLMQLLTVISTIDDLNYPEKTETYYIVNAPYIFSACWKVCIYHIIIIKMNSTPHTPPTPPPLPETRLKSKSLDAAGCKASPARKNKEENSGAAR